MTITFQVQWQLDGVDVSGSTAGTFGPITAAMRGKRVGFRLIATGSNGIPSPPVQAPPVLVPTVGPALTISGTPPAATSVGSPYLFTPTVAGGTPPYTFFMPSGALPLGLSLNADTGTISGTTTTAQTQTGLVERVTDHVGATADLGPFSIAVSAPSSKLAPSASWNGTAGSGYGGAHSPIPTPVARSTAMPWLLPLFVPWMTVTGDVVVGFESGAGSATGVANGGVSHVQVYLEGNFVNLTQETSYTFTDVNGVSQTLPAGWFTTLDYATWIALSSSGEALMYAVAYPTDPTMQPRTVGPYSFYARTSEFSVTKTVAPSGADYTSLQAGLTYAAANPTQRVRLLIKTTGNYPLGFVSHQGGQWTTIQADTGISATMGDGTASFTQCGYDGIEFRGAGIKWDTAQLGYSLSAWRFSNGTQNRLWLNGADVFCGAADPAHGGSGSGASALINGGQPNIFWVTGNDSLLNWNLYFTEVTAHDLPAYGLSFYTMRRNSTADNVSGSDNENGRLLYGGWSNKVGGYYSGLRTQQGAFDLTGPVGSAYAKTGVNGASGNFQLFDVAANASPTYSLPTGASVAAMITAINGCSGWHATATPSTTSLNSTYLSRADLAPSAAIPKTTLVGTAHITRIADIHADCIVHHSLPWTNGAERFFENRLSVGTAFISYNGDYPIQDWGSRNLSNQDVSASLSEPTQPGYWGGDRSHWVVQYNSNTNPSGYLFLNGSTSDVYCDVDHTASALGWSGAPDADQRITSLAAPALPSGADSNSKVVSGDPAVLYAAPGATPPNFTPKTPLVLANGTVAGRLKTNGAQQGI